MAVNTATRDAYRPAEVARRTGVCPTTVRRWVRAGVLPAVKVNSRCVLIPAPALDAFLAGHAAGPHPTEGATS